jgi:sulfite exporter TauE/SafE
MADMNLVQAGSVCATNHLFPATPVSFFMLVGAGLLTGLSHCVGMCGPLVGALALRRQAAQADLATPLVLYQMGRLTTYGLLGAIVGSGGGVLAAAMRDWQGVFAVALGILVILLGFGLLDLFPLQRWIASVAPVRLVSRWVKYCLTSQHPATPFGLGLGNGLLPCGAIYAMLVLASLSGDLVKGAGLMLLFGLGTLPAMLGFGLFSGLVSLRLRSHLYRVAAFLLVVVGLQLTLRGLALHGQLSHTTMGGIMLW